MRARSSRATCNHRYGAGELLRLLAAANKPSRGAGKPERSSDSQIDEQLEAVGGFAEDDLMIGGNVVVEYCLRGSTSERINHLVIIESQHEILRVSPPTPDETHLHDRHILRLVGEDHSRPARRLRNIPDADLNQIAKIQKAAVSVRRKIFSSSTTKRITVTAASPTARRPR